MWLHRVGTERWSVANVSTGYISGNSFCENDRLRKEMFTDLRKPCTVTADGTNVCFQTRKSVKKLSTSFSSYMW